MPSDMNSVNLIGRLTRDPELRTIPSGTSVCELGVAVNERVKNSASGQWEERANFFDVTVWGAQGENCAKYLSKGRPVGINGRLRWESWEKDGQKRSKVKIVAETVQFLGGGDRDGGGGRASDVPVDEKDFALPTAGVTATDDDIPF